MNQIEQNGRQLLEKWDHFRATSGASEGDDRFRHFLMEYIPAEQARLGEPLEDRLHAHAASTIAVVDLCEALGRNHDALTVTEWAAREHVPRGGDVAVRTVWACTDACRVASSHADLFQRSTDLLEWIARALPRGERGEAAIAASRTLLVLASIYQTTTDRANHSEQSRKMEKILGRIITTWPDSEDPAVRFHVHSARLNRALVRIELADESGARQDLVRLASITQPERDMAGVGEFVDVAEHAIPILDTFGKYPDPEFNLRYLKAQRRRDLRELRLRTFARNNPARYARLASDAHRRTVRLLTRLLVTGLPVVLLLRNFEMVESSHIGEVLFSDGGYRKEHVRRISATKGASTIDRLSTAVDLVSVSNAAAGELELDAVGLDFGRPALRRPLYLSNDDWLSSVAELVAVADVILMWTSEKSPGVVQELELVQRLGRAGDSYALLEPQVDDPVYPALTKQPRKDTAPLTASDPLLAGYRDVVELGTDRPTADAGPAAAERLADEVLSRVQELGRRERTERIRTLAARAGHVWS
ncbi:hypothetical protein [Myceligenerans pegani]|uniref:Uncharacterized protein n=1 Tax=Myceligenerans pegani TaxID=2776917 RepID=A0ABR9N460_9MICO|nr:hypothetical protein [Myceligenerans sp. TRM 65318]MBE1878457.1 hypothetical protein [Myceligenerans sp. TRM 65318]MBE3020728.1 hypothetical protein [Myceligenerans sp. TRM 65318]